MDISSRPVTARQHSLYNPSNQAPLSRAVGRQRSLERWENEGGTFLAGPVSAAEAANPSSREVDAPGAALRDMTGSLYRDFAEGNVGDRYNTFAHRSRVLRQLTARLAAMRSASAAARPGLTRRVDRRAASRLSDA